MKTLLKEKHKRRKKREKRLIFGIATGFIIVVSIIVMYACGIIGSRSEVIAGTWKYDDYMSFEFDGKKNGYMYLGELEYDYTYTVRRNRLKLDFTDEAVKDCAYEFEVNEDSLTLVGEEGTYKLQREH